MSSFNHMGAAAPRYFNSVRLTLIAATLASAAGCAASADKGVSAAQDRPATLVVVQPALASEQRPVNTTVTTTSAVSTTVAPGYAEGRDGRWGEREGHEDEHDRRPPIFFEALHAAELTPAQKEQVRDILEGARKDDGEEFMRLHQDRVEFETSEPDASDYKSLGRKIAHEEARFVETRAKQEAEVRSKIFNLLTQDQKVEFRKALNEAAEMPPQHHHHGHPQPRQGDNTAP